MGPSFSLWNWLIVLAVFGTPIWFVVRATRLRKVNPSGNRPAWREFGVGFLIGFIIGLGIVVVPICCSVCCASDKRPEAASRG